MKKRKHGSKKSVKKGDTIVLNGDLPPDLSVARDYIYIASTIDMANSKAYDRMKRVLGEAHSALDNYWLSKKEEWWLHLKEQTE